METDSSSDDGGDEEEGEGDGDGDERAGTESDDGEDEEEEDEGKFCWLAIKGNWSFPSIRALISLWHMLFFLKFNYL